MRTRITVWDRNICPHCTRRAYCAQRNATITSCVGDSFGSGYYGSKKDGKAVLGYKRDNRAFKKRIAEAKAKLDALRKTFKRVKPEQLELDSCYRVRFQKLDNATLKANSRQGQRETIDELTYRKWCEQCGAAFETLNTRRKLCNACHDEICECIGANYAMPNSDDLGVDDVR